MENQKLPVIGLFDKTKLRSMACAARLTSSSRVVDFGCGYGDALILWAAEFGAAGVGIDSTERHIDKANTDSAAAGVSDRLRFECGDATTIDLGEREFDLAVCLTATGMFGESQAMFRNAIRRLSQVVRQEGYILVAEAYYTAEEVDAELVEFEGDLHTEAELIAIVREEGFVLSHLVHSDRADWDRYISSNANRDVEWLKASPDHPDRQNRIDGVNRWWNMYVGHRLPMQRCAAFLITRV